MKARMADDEMPCCSGVLRGSPGESFTEGVETLMKCCPCCWAKTGGKTSARSSHRSREFRMMYLLWIGNRSPSLPAPHLYSRAIRLESLFNDEDCCHRRSRSTPFDMNFCYALAKFGQVQDQPLQLGLQMVHTSSLFDWVVRFHHRPTVSRLGKENGNLSGVTRTPVVNLNGYFPPLAKVNSTK